MRDRGEPALLRGVLRCAGCRRLLTTSTQKVGGGRTVRYDCRSDDPPCPSRVAIRDTVVEPYVEALLWQELPRLHRSGAARRVRQLEAEVERHDADLARYRDNPSIISTLGIERYEQGLEVRSRRLDRALLALAAARRRDDTRELPGLEDARRRWPSQTLSERRELVRSVFDCVFVLNETPGSQG